MQIHLSPGEIKYLIQLIEDHDSEIQEPSFKLLIKDIKERFQKVLGIKNDKN